MYFPLKPVLNIEWSCLAKYLQWLRQELPKTLQSLFKAKVHHKSCCVKELGEWAKWPKMTTERIWLASQFMMARPSHRPLFKKRHAWCAESGERKDFTDRGWDWSFYWICAGVSKYCGTHLIQVTKTEIKEGNALLLTTKAFGWRGPMDLCSYQELKWQMATSQSEPSPSQQSYIKNGLLYVWNYRFLNLHLEKTNNMYNSYYQQCA